MHGDWLRKFCAEELTQEQKQSPPDAQKSAFNAHLNNHFGGKKWVMAMWQTGISWAPSRDMVLNDYDGALEHVLTDPSDAPTDGTPEHVLPDPSDASTDGALASDHRSPQPHIGAAQDQELLGASEHKSSVSARSSETAHSALLVFAWTRCATVEIH